MCWFNKTVPQQHELNTFRKIFFLVGTFFPIWLAEKFEIIMVKFHSRVSVDKKKCSQLSYLLAPSFKKKHVRVKGGRKKMLKKVLYDMFAITFFAKSAQRLCQDSNFLIFPMGMKISMNEADRNLGQLSKNQTIVFMIILCFFSWYTGIYCIQVFFVIYWYLLYTSFKRNIHCNK